MNKFASISSSLERWTDLNCCWFGLCISQNGHACERKQSALSLMLPLAVVLMMAQPLKECTTCDLLKSRRNEMRCWICQWGHAVWLKYALKYITQNLMTPASSYQWRTSSSCIRDMLQFDAMSMMTFIYIPFPSAWRNGPLNVSSHIWLTKTIITNSNYIFITLSKYHFARFASADVCLDVV